MKKIMILTIILTSATLLSSCSAKSNPSNQEKQSSEVIVSNDSSTNIQETNVILEGVLSEDVQETDSSDEAIRLVLKDIQAIEDPENIASALKTDGVILNVPVEIMPENFSTATWVTGDKIQFELSAMPMMTASIPPQIPGNSIILVEKIK